MPDLRPRRAWPTVPEEEACKSGRSAHGAVLASFYDYQSHLGFVRGRRAAHLQCTYSVNTSTITPIGASDVVEIVWKSSPAVEHVVIGFLYQCSVIPESASEATSLGTPIDIKVDGFLYNHDTSALIDGPGCRWTYADGHLQPTLWSPGISPSPGATVDLSGFVHRYEEAYAHSTRRLESGAGAITEPRALEVDSGGKGATLRVRLEPTNARILAVDIWERFEDVVTL